MAWGCLASLESAFGASQNTVDGALFHNLKMRRWIKYIYARCAILKEKEYFHFHCFHFFMLLIHFLHLPVDIVSKTPLNITTL